VLSETVFPKPARSRKHDKQKMPPTFRNGGKVSAGVAEKLSKLHGASGFEKHGRAWIVAAR
jgi:hypothetical protein